MNQDLSRGLAQRDYLAALGTFALKTADEDELLGEMCRLVAAGLGVSFCKFLQPVSGESALLVRAGVGWRPGVVGHAKLGADLASPAGFALRTGQPVLSSDLAAERRFRTPALLREHGIQTAMNVIVRGERDVFGVLEADGRRPGALAAGDIGFMQAAANLLGLAMERAVRERRLREALAAREVLLREADHRIKNSLQLVASLLTMQRSRLSDAEAAAALDEAIARVHAVAQAHRAFQRSSDLRHVSFGDMLRDICDNAARFDANIRIECEIDGDLDLDSERAIPLGLIASEWLTNAMQHAYQAGEPGVILARAGASEAELWLEISDNGGGMAEPEPAEPPSLGTSIVRALVRQIGAAQEIESRAGRGTTARLRLPRQPEPTA